ncbi:MLO-like protein [Citrus sinensis]|uniref:MLO-like protein n=1 Tax=Citrus sinensis TaxID=2711 RepID=A0ACB8KZ29_CITSI|nr:MLO-like protein [Citrus sinensis]
MAGGGAAAGAAAAGDRSLRDTPTWAVALVCAVLLILSILIEHGIHSLSKWFQKRQKKAMSEALEKIKAELMLLGFLSLLLTVGTRFIYKICIPAEYGNTMLPCKIENDTGGDDDDHRRKLLLYSGDVMWRRVLAAPAGGDDYCSRKGQVSLISLTGLHQLHIFIFVLAVFHVLYSVITIALAKAKMKKWQAWELETNSLEYQFTNDPARFRFTHQTSFVKRHSGLSRTPGIRWIVAFFRQFFGSVSKVDYMTMRHGFINAHFAPNTSFDFHKYIKRSLEDDFKVVVGISIPLWIVAVIFLLVNVYKWDSLSWLTVAPLVIILLVGTKLELVIMEMAQEIQDRTTVVRGAPVVEPNNKFFWFNRPEWILFLIHYTLFQNAFQMAFFLWIVYEFGIHSCFHENLPLILTRVIVGVALQFLCSYITFPLYALVTQMGSHMKKSIFEEQTAKALKKWQKAAKERRRSRNKAAAGADKCSGIMSIHGHGSPSPPSSGFLSGENTPSQGASPIHLLHHYKYRSNQQDIESVRSYQSDNELSEIEPSSTHHHHQDQGRDEDLHNSDFSFVKL